DNKVYGNAGADELLGRAGSDEIYGGDGNDLIEGGAGADKIDGGAGNDTASYAFGSVGVSISLANGTASGGDAQGDQLASIENLTGTDAADQLEGDDQTNVLSGGRGDDLLVGGGGDDTLIGGRGADTLIGGDGIDTVNYSLSVEGVTIDLANGMAGSGDAQGDNFTEIEIVEGSYHDDIIRGDDNDNRLRGGLGADVIDGRGGFDIADYSTAEVGVGVDLGAGVGNAGEALGDTLIDIEMLLGSNWVDTLRGGAGDEMFDGGYGNDLVFGAAGSDRYLFGFDSGEDVVTELGNASDVDRIVLQAGIAPKDFSLLREGDDLLVELERDDGILIDTVRIKDHFLGNETGIEEILFANGVTWDRAQMEALVRLGRFNAADDLFRFATEDEVAIIDPAQLVLNDVTEGWDQLTLVSVGNALFGTVSITADGKIAFLGNPDHNGDAWFDYTVRDQYGRESTATVEVNLTPVNDAPVAVDDGPFGGIEDVPLRIRIENLLVNDYDVDGDADLEGLRIVDVQPLVGIDGNKLDPYRDPSYQGEGTNVAWKFDGAYLELKPRPDYFGFAGFVYTLMDASGATSTGRVELYFDPVNDAPRLHDQRRVIRLEQTTTITVAELMALSYDVEGDAISFVGLHYPASGNPAVNGQVVFDEAAGTIAFTPDALGDASLSFDVIDARG
ncbi:MAG TPA: tandem-95 repeat protein, partial [Sphingopyxis sp.]|nr:tandem-95 repeat protein [Sphingopyxis sp.]